MKKRTICAILLLTILISIPFADTHVGGNITTDTYWTLPGSPYIVDSPILVYNSAVLTIDAGVVIMFDTSTGLTIGRENSGGCGGRAAALSAEGEPGFPVIFTSLSDTGGDWKGIVFDDCSDAGISSSMTYCIVEKAGKANSYGVSAALFCRYTNSPSITHTIIRSDTGNTINLVQSSISISNSVIEGAGTSNVISMDNPSSPIFTNDTISANGNYFWFFCSDNGSNPQITNCAFNGSVTRALRLGTNFLMSGCQFSGMANAEIEVIGGDFTGNRTWQRQIGISTYRIKTNNVRVFNSYTFTISPGVTMAFDASTGLQIGLENSGGCGGHAGALWAIGTEDEPIVFTSSSGSSGGWKGIVFDDCSDASMTSSMNYCIVEKAGIANSYGSTTAIFCRYTNSPTITNNRILAETGSAIYLTSSSINISHSLIAGSGMSNLIYMDINSSPTFTFDSIYGEGNPYWILCGNNNCYPQITGCVFNGNVEKAVRLGTSFEMSDCRFSGAAEPAIEVLGGDIAGSRTWHKYPGASEYNIIANNFRVFNSYTLTIEPGVTLKFDPSTELRIGLENSGGCGGHAGALWAIGTEDEPIVFTSSSGSSGGWKGIVFDDCSDAVMSSILKHCIIEKAGITNTYSRNSNIYCRYTTTPKIDSCEINSSSNMGIYLDHSALADTLMNNKICNNGDNGINITTSSSLILGASAQNRNEIHDNGAYNINNTSANNITATYNNWGGLADSASVAATIYDHHENPAYGYVYFMPFDASVMYEHLVIMVTGNASDDYPNYEYTLEDTRLMFNALLNNGYTKDEILLLHTVASYDFDGDIGNDVDLVTSSENIDYSINSWATDLSNDATSLLIWLRGHGDRNAFLIPGSRIAESHINALIQNYKDATSAEHVLLITNSCYSGSLIDAISGNADLIITSADTNQQEHVFCALGRTITFPAILAKILGKGYSFGVAYNRTARAIENLMRNSEDYTLNPLLDDNHDALGSRQPIPSTSGDGAFAMSHYLSLGGLRRSMDETPPVIDTFIVDTLGSEIWIYAEVSSDIAVDTLYVILAMDDSSYIEYPEDSTAPVIIKYPIIAIPEVSPFTYEIYLPDTYSAGIINYIFLAEDTSGDFGEIVMTDTTRDTTRIAIGKNKPNTFEIIAVPNPFNSSCAISAPKGVSIEIFDINGKKIAQLAEGQRIWTPEKEIGSGVYLIRAKFGVRTITRRAVLIR